MNRTRPEGDCPDLEALAAFADGALSGPDTAAVAQHVEACERCYELVVEVLKAQEEPAATPAGWSHAGRATTGLRRNWLAYTAAAIGFVAVGLAWSMRHDPLERAMGQLTAAVDDRVVEGRLSADFGWAPLPDALRGRADVDLAPPVRDAVFRIEDLTTDPVTPDAMQARAIALLIRGQHQQSVELLERAVRAAPSDAALRSDLSAALIERWRATSDAGHLILALDEAERALVLEPRGVSAAFNRAVAREALGSPSEARTAWEHYLAIDATSAWAAEARRRLEALGGAAAPAGEGSAAIEDWPVDALRRQAAVDPTSLYLHIERIAIPAWASAALGGGRPDTDSLLRVADALAAAGRDTGPIDAAHAIRDSAGWPASRRQCLADAWQAFTRSRARYEAFALDEARELGVEADRAFACAGASRDLARLNLGSVLMAAGDYAGAREAVRRVDADALTAAGSHRLAVWRLQLQGLDALNRTEFEPGLRAFQAALRQAEHSGDLEVLLRSTGYLVTVLDELGDEQRARTYLAASLAHLDRLRNHHLLYQVLMNATIAAADAGHAGASWALAQESVRRLADSETTLHRVMTRLNRARAAAALGLTTDARVDLEAARTLIDAVPDDRQAEALEAESALTAGRVRLAIDPAQAAGDLSAAIELFERRGDSFRKATLLLLRGRAFAALGRQTDAERDWDEAAGIVEGQRARLEDRTLRVLRTDEIWDLYEELVRSRLDRPRAALASLERGHARELLDVLDRDVPVIAAGDDFHWLPADLLVVAYAVLPERLLIWTVTREGVDLVERREPRDALERLVAKHREAVTGPGLTGPSDELASRILPPAVVSGAFSRIVFVPDGALHHVAFGALRLDDGRFLVERLTPSISPSLSVLRAMLAAPPPASGKALLMGASPARPEHDLPALPAVAREIRQLVRLYPRHAVLMDEHVTLSALQAAAPDAAVIHFAGHAIADTGDPGRSRLLLGGPEGAATASDLAQLRLARGALVVLSACDTGVGSIYRGASSMNLAHPFIAAGASTVVASLWRVRDEAAATLMLAFHERIRAGATAAAALAAAQREALEAGRPPADWAAFTVMGS